MRKRKRIKLLTIFYFRDCLSKVSYVLTILGEKSARAQGLQKVITSGEKLRNSDHIVYILIDPKGGSK